MECSPFELVTSLKPPKPICLLPLPPNARLIAESGSCCKSHEGSFMLKYKFALNNQNTRFVLILGDVLLNSRKGIWVDSYKIQ